VSDPILSGHHRFLKANNCLSYLAGSLLDGGGHTTGSFLRSIVLMLVAFPEAQEKAFQEVNRTVGMDIPTIDYRNDLPYLNAFISEVSRRSLD
jgi:cytochrome P450